MPEAAGWQFAVEVHPADWRFPAGPSWVAGWIFAGPERVATDVRAWIDHQPFLGIAGQPRPELDEKLLGRAGPPHAGFVCQVTPAREATLLRLELRDPAGGWTEFFRTPIRVAPDAAPAARPAPLSTRLADLLPALLRQHGRQPPTPLATIADELVAHALAIPLNTLPNPPFHGALEEPRETGRLRYGRLPVTGWLAHGSEIIRRLTAVADGWQESSLLHGLARKDVGDVFANLPGREQSQFVGQVDLPPGATGPALLRIFAELENGEKHLAFAQRFTPKTLAGAEAPLPALSRVTFARALWALIGSARRHGLPLGALSTATRAAWGHYAAAAPKRATALPSSADMVLPGKSRPLRLLAVTHNLNFEGAPRLLLELTRFLATQTGGSGRVLSPQEGPMRQLFEEAGMAVDVVDVRGALGAKTPPEFDAALSAAVKVNWSEVDLVIANTLASFWAVRAAAQAGKPVVFYVHESAPVARFFGSSLEPALFPVVEAALRTATRVAFTADASRVVFVGADPARNFRVLPSWLDVAAIDAFAAANSKAALRRKHGIDPNAIVLLNLGTVCERKGQHTFLRAAALLEPELRARGGRSVEFVMVGAREDGFLALLRLQAADAGLRSARFVPETRENFDWLRLADALVCTSFEESSPRVLIEAAAFHLPIATTHVNGIPELVGPDEAWMIPPGDPRQLAEAIRAMLAAIEAKDTTRPDRARRIVLDRFDERVSLPRHLALANEAVAAYPDPHA